MELSLSRVDLLQVGTTSRNTLKLLPLSKRSTQKVVVGDNSGVIHCFGVKKGQASESFVSKPLSKDIGAVSLGGGSKGNNFIFAAAGRTITGFSRKGKPIYEFPCPQTEDIRGLQVVQTEERIFAAGDFVLTEYCKGQEENYFQSNDKINDLLLQKPGGGAFESALACQDRQIRVVRGSQCVQQATVGGPATAVTNFDANGAFDQEFVASEQQNELGRLRLQVSELQAKLRAANDGESASIEEELQRRTRELASHEASAGSSARQLLYGTENGIVGTLSFTPEGLHPGWFIANVKRLGGINALATCDITKDGRTDVLVGRDDGTLEVWSCDIGEEPSLIFSRCINESISAVGCGVITTAESEDVIVSTFSGRVVAFSSAATEGGDGSGGAAAAAKKAGGDEAGTIRRVTDKDIKRLNGELDALKDKLKREKAKFKEGAGEGQELIATTNTTRMKESFTLDQEDACYVMTVEIESSIDCVIVQSTAAVELVDVDSNLAIVCPTAIPPPTQLSTAGAGRSTSVTGGSNGSKNKMLATFRCQEPTRRMQFKVRTTEGAFGHLTTYVVPTVSPKTCQSITHQLKTLSLHIRVPDVDVADDRRPLCKLCISGGFSIGQAHSWVRSCLPEVPERLQGDEAHFTFHATFVPSLLKCTYKKGEAVFESDSVITLAILKDFVTKDATATKTTIDIASDISDETVEHFLRMVGPILDFQLDLQRKHELIEALQELKMQESDVESWLEEEYQDVLANAGLIQAEIKHQPMRLQRLHELVVTVFAERARFHGQSMSERTKTALRQTLMAYEQGIEGVITFFQQHSH